MLSVVIITLNEEANIRACLESVRWADETIVMDSISQDKTCQIAREYTDKVFQQKFLGDGPMKNSAIQKTSNDWILVLDADERVSPELRNEIELVLKSPAYYGYEIPYKVYFLGRWMRHGGFRQEYHLRLFKKNKGRFTEVPAHARVVVEGRTGKLRHSILHHTCNNLSDYIAKLNSHTDLIATDPTRRSSVPGAVLHAWARFIKMYILKAGFLDGKEGFIVSALLSYYVLVKHLKLWHASTSSSSAGMTGSYKGPNSDLKQGEMRCFQQRPTSIAERP